MWRQHWGREHALVTLTCRREHKGKSRASECAKYLTKHTVITEAGGGEKKTLDLRECTREYNDRVRSLLQIRFIFVRDTRETGIKRLNIHSDDGLNTNLELKFCAFFDVRVFNPYAPSNRQPLIAKARPTMLAFRLVIYMYVAVRPIWSRTGPP